MALLEVRGVGKTFGALRALDGVDVTVEANSFHGLIGPNGSGKSTLLKAIAGDHFADDGTIVFDGRDITTMRPALRSRRGLSLKFQITAVLLEHWEEPEGGDGEQGTVRIFASVLVERSGQKKILVGRKGSMIKEIGTLARLELESFLSRPVYL